MDAKANSINVKRVLDVVIQDRKKIYTKDDFHRELGQTSYPRIEEAVNYLSKEKIFIKSHGVGAPPKESNKVAKRKAFFELSSSVAAFSKIFAIYFNSKEVELLLKSEYSTRVLQKHSFVKYHEKIITSHLNDSIFLKLASRILLNHPAVIREYEEIARQLRIEMLNAIKNKNTLVQSPSVGKKYLIDILCETADELSTNKIEYIDILRDYDSLLAVKLYRKTIHMGISNVYNELAEEGAISGALKRFLIFDNYLSPLTAYPVNGTLRVLFSRPFERIYDDAYLLDGESFELLSGRAAAIYCDFSEFIFELIKTDKVSEKDLETMTKRMIYHWNVASTRFDLICIKLNEIYGKRAVSGNYHLKTDGLEFNIIDLKIGKKLLPPEVAKSILMVGSSPAIFKESSNDDLFMKNMKNPFTCLRPCLTFGDLGWKSDCVHIEEILSQLKLKLSERNVGYLSNLPL